MKTIRNAIRLLFIPILLCASPLLYADTIPGVPLVRQEKTNWCWAAASQCVLRYHITGFTKTQTQIAAPITSENIAPLPEEIEPLLEEHGKPVNLEVNIVDRPLTWEEMRIEAEARRPFMMMIRWKSGTYHMNVYAGYVDDSTRIKFLDPAWGWMHRTYGTSLVIDGDRGDWEKTFLIRKAGSLIKPRNPLRAAVFEPFEIRHHRGKPIIFLHRSLDIAACLVIISANGRVNRIAVNGDKTTPGLDQFPPGGYCAYMQADQYRSRPGIFFAVQ